MKREFHLNFTKTAGPRLRCFVETRCIQRTDKLVFKNEAEQWFEMARFQSCHYRV